MLRLILMVAVFTANCQTSNAQGSGALDDSTPRYRWAWGSSGPYQTLREIPTYGDDPDYHRQPDPWNYGIYPGQHGWVDGGENGGQFYMKAERIYGHRTDDGIFKWQREDGSFTEGIPLKRGQIPRALQSSWKRAGENTGWWYIEENQYVGFLDDNRIFKVRRKDGSFTAGERLEPGQHPRFVGQY